ncbi:MAG: HD domain-containing protein [Candidatus Bathyarchaeota archaeon]|nr:HD domain-containing protein [Candidatus Bathyarchaeota archaeon]
MITKKEALRLIENTSKKNHSLLVGKTLRVLAGNYDEDRGLWELVGLLHDLDYDETRDDPSKHGLKAAQSLEGQLPAQALYAIMAHDHLSGMELSTRLDHSLVFSDAIAILIEEGQLAKPVEEKDISEALSMIAESKPWIRDQVENFPFKDGLNLPIILNIII